MQVERVGAAAKHIGADRDGGTASFLRPALRSLHQQPSRSETSASFLNHQAAELRCAVALQRAFNVDMHPTGERRTSVLRARGLGNKYGMRRVSQNHVQPPLNLLWRRRVAELIRKLSESASILRSCGSHPERYFSFSRHVSASCNRTAEDRRRYRRLRRPRCAGHSSHTCDV